MESTILALANVAFFDSPAFHRHLAALQDKMDPNHEHDCGGFASIWFTQIDPVRWYTMTPAQRAKEVEDYVDAQLEEIAYNTEGGA